MRLKHQEKEQNEIENYRQRDCDSLRVSFYFQVGWNSEQIFHCGIQARQI